MSKVILIKDLVELDEILSNNQNVIVDYFADWCGPCKMLLPVLDKVSNELDNVTICKIDVEVNTDIARSNGVRNIPTIIYYKDGEMVTTTTGYLPKNALIDTIKTNLKLN